MILILTISFIFSLLGILFLIAHRKNKDKKSPDFYSGKIAILY